MSTLFTIETEHVALVWSRRRRKPVSVMPTEEEGSPFGLAVQTLQRGVKPAVHVHASDDDRHLFEQTDYTLLVRAKTALSVAVRHRDPVLIHGLHRSGDGRVVHGTLNFGTQVGHSRFVVEVGGRPSVALEVEVFPSKMDYRNDYAALRDDVRAVERELVLSYLRATYASSSRKAPEEAGTLGWVLLLRHVAADLERAMDYIARQPRWGTRRTIEEARVDRIRRPDAALRRAVVQGKGRGAWQVLPDGPSVRERLPGGRGRYTLDTPAHRWLAARLARVRMRLAEVCAEEARHPATVRRERVLEELEDLRHGLVRLSRLPVLQATDGEPPPEPPLVLLTAPGYREAYQACLCLRQGLVLDGGPLALGVKELHVLYEYWCFLTLVLLVARVTGHAAPLRSLIAVERQGLRVRLRKGRTQTVTVPLDGGGRLELTYNPRFGGKRYLVPQQPDFLLTVHHPDGRADGYVLDAKYRLDASPAYRKRYGVPGPPRDALNDLHRYRDAIRDAAGRRTVMQAVALYPFREEEEGLFARSRLRRLQDEVGVGAIPLLPGHTGPLAAWLHRMLDVTV